jgi:hypothetical protein
MTSSPIEPIPGIADPFNATPYSWDQLQEFSNAARHLGIGAFICTNCLEKKMPHPWFYFEDGYGFGVGPSGHPIGICRRCAPEAHEAGLALEPRSGSTKTVLALCAVAIVAALLFWLLA